MTWRVMVSLLLLHVVWALAHPPLQYLRASEFWTYRSTGPNAYTWEPQFCGTLQLQCLLLVVMTLAKLCGLCAVATGHPNSSLPEERRVWNVCKWLFTSSFQINICGRPRPLPVIKMETVLSANVQLPAQRVWTYTCARDGNLIERRSHYTPHTRMATEPLLRQLQVSLSLPAHQPLQPRPCLHQLSLSLPAHQPSQPRPNITS